MSSSLSRWECFKILDVPSNASQDEIRQAYKTKALDNHPDKNPDDPKATERFQRISQAYRVLAKDTGNYGDSNYGDSSDSDEEFGGGGFGFMFSYFRMFEEIVREARMEEARRRQQRMDAILLEQLFGQNSWRSNPWQQTPHRRRGEGSPPRRTTQQTSGRSSQQNSGRSSQQNSGRSSQQNSWKNSQQTTGRNSQQTSGRSSQQFRGRSSQQTSGKSSQQTSGRSSQQTSGRSSQEKTRKTSPHLRKNTSRPSKEKEPTRGKYPDRKSSDTDQTYTSFKNQQGRSSKVSDDEGSKHKTSSDPPKEQCTHPEPSRPVGGDRESDQLIPKPSGWEFNTSSAPETKPQQNQTTIPSSNPKTTYEKYQPKKLSKKQLLALQSRRAKEAVEIGKEIRKKNEMSSNLKSSQDIQV